MIKRNVKFSIIHKKILYFSFVIIPIIVMLININKELLIEPYGIDKFSAKADSGEIIEQEVEYKVIESELENNFMEKMSYVIGKKIDLPIFNICFFNNATSNNLTEFKGELNINGDLHEIPNNEIYCEKMEADIPDLIIKWTTEGTSKEGKSIKFNKAVFLEKNENYKWVIAIIIIGWLSVFRLVYRTIKDFINIGKN